MRIEGLQRIIDAYKSQAKQEGIFTLLFLVLAMTSPFIHEGLWLWLVLGVQLGMAGLCFWQYLVHREAASRLETAYPENLREDP